MERSIEMQHNQQQLSTHSASLEERLAIRAFLVQIEGGSRYLSHRIRGNGFTPDGRTSAAGIEVMGNQGT